MTHGGTRPSLQPEGVGLKMTQCQESVLQSLALEASGWLGGTGFNVARHCPVCGKFLEASDMSIS